MLLSTIHSAKLNYLLGGDTKIDESKIDKLLIMEEGSIDHQKNLQLFFNMPTYHLKLSKKITSILCDNLHLNYTTPEVYQIILFLMSNGNKTLSSLFPINKRTKNQFKILRSIGFLVIEPQNGKIIFENAHLLDYSNLINLLTKDGIIKYFERGAIIPNTSLPKYVWICLSEKKIKSILTTINKEKSPILMVSMFINIITDKLKLSRAKIKNSSPHSKFTKQCNQLHYYQKKRGGLLYKYPQQKHLSLRWAFKLEDEFRLGNIDASEKTLNNIHQDLNYLIFPVSVL